MREAPTDPTNAAHGTPDALREFAGDALAMAQITAEIGAKYAALGDDVGLNYTARQLAAYTKAILATVADLQAYKTEAADAGRK
jgi:hypothetical protein